MFPCTTVMWLQDVARDTPKPSYQCGKTPVSLVGGSNHEWIFAAVRTWARVSLCNWFHLCFCEIAAWNVINILLIDHVLLHPSALNQNDNLYDLIDALQHTTTCSRTSSSPVNDRYMHSYAVKCSFGWDPGMRGRGPPNWGPHICPSMQWVLKSQSALSGCT